MSPINPIIDSLYRIISSIYNEVRNDVEKGFENDSELSPFNPSEGNEHI